MAERVADRVMADLARERGGALVNYAVLLTGDSAAAQDLVQDAFVKVFVRLRTGFTPDAAEAYVRRAILTLYVDGYRRRQRWASVRHLVAAGPQERSREMEFADRIDLRAALAGLSPQERACVVLRFYEDLRVADVAAQMHLAEGTVKRYLSNAVHKLETTLGPMRELHPLDDEMVVVDRVHPTTTARG
ncbi:sigma-70 family RNA polymerase sigma factor [Pengzhenrongella sicca]|uniref:Sigma-70 family RNA polymerase sigma factor n=1 Tax=Pengzhenrongella sicca TaxID=2819238 RepID=A0A8A4ZHS3_9MICO|nr:sigma-70 family RNA polymerase sigma factor [Pengzhenrongella sicca]QTE30941.1 sigma-70 family RNA polymerase sigma factor [Pengzhenrongella sicca]